MSDTECVFCGIASGKQPADVKAEGIDSLMFTPLHPVTPGHLLVIPRIHVPDAFERPGITATTLYDATHWASILRRMDGRYENVNLITSVGPAATQSVFHLHVHIVPRTEGDGLHLPWTGQNTKPRQGL